jgi:suppressor for copper-sensitivity B
MGLAFLRKTKAWRFCPIFLVFWGLLHAAFGVCPPLTLSLVPKSFQNGTAEGYLVVLMEKGWKLYAPQKESDTVFYTPEILWKEGSQNIKDLSIRWPEGIPFGEGGLQGHGYKNAVIAPFTLHAQTDQQAIRFQGTLKALACSGDRCQPVACPLSLSFTPHTPYPHPEPVLNTILAGVTEQGGGIKEGISLGTLVLLALLGGLILNFMPCVLPVLGIKLMILTKTATAGGPFPVREFWMTVGGIFATFLTFALGTIVLKELGETIGWGIHFQNPYFLSCMLVVLSLFAANLMGIFELATPSWAQWFASFNSLKPWKSFFSGVLSVLLATPCAAPFVGTAVGFALTRDAGDILAVFGALATGFSAPYWVTAFLPSHRLTLPRPGRWLVILQRLLGVMLMATVLWLAFLLTAHKGSWFALVVYGLTGTLFLCFFMVRRGTSWAFVPLFVSLVLLLGAPLLRKVLPQETLPDTVTQTLWQPLEPEKIPVHLAKGRLVLVDLTASWCVTCHVNKRLVLNKKDVMDFLAQKKVLLMRGDWTSPDPVIARFLRGFNKAGVPLNVVFGPNAPQGIVLPEILTKLDVIQAVQEAKGVFRAKSAQ